MERLKSITIIFLLAIGLPASAAPAKSASVLLQEGLYAEEIEGDLDAAIKIYEQVIAEAKKTQRAAAQATYRIGMCYLKKGEKAQAAQQFRELIVKFPEHESLVAKAQEHLAKLKPPVTITGGFGPVRKRIVNDDGVGKNFMLDLDTGSLFSVSDAQDKSVSLEDFILEQGIDVIGETKSSVRGLMGIDMVVIPIANERWDISPEDVAEGVSLGSPGRPVVMSGKGELPATFIFKTKQGNMGVLQILEVEAGKAPRHVRVRYKMLQEPGTVRPTFDFGPEVERIIHSEETGKPFFFDLDTAKAFSPPPGLTRSSPEREVIEWSATKGIDFVNSRGHLELVEMTTVKVESDMWESATPAEIKDALLKGSTQNFLPTRSKDYTISSPITYVFKTREGGIGILQILEKKDNNLRIRYKMLQEPGTVRPTFDFGPEVERIIYTDETGKDCFFDLDTGKAFSIPQGLTRSSDPEKGIPWILENGIDFVNCVGRLQLWDMVAVEVEEKIWDSEDAVEINSVLMRDPSKEFLPTEQEEYIITAPFIYAFETREGGIGILQILEKKDNNLRIRYKMLQERAKTVTVGCLKGLVGHWKFDEGRGTTAYDSAGSNDGTIYDAQWTGGRVNGALYFDSRDDYVSISPVVLSTNWTVSAWCQPLRNEVGGCNPIMGGPEDYDNYIILCEAKHHINLETDMEGDWVIVGRGVVDFNEWAHYTVTRNGNTVSAYKNGVYIDDATLPKGDENTITKIGSGYGCQTYYKGRIDDVRIYNRALSKQEVRSLYRSIVGSAGDERVTAFGPAKVARLYDIDHPTTAEKECAIDFDTGKLSKIPPQARQMPGDDLMKWLSGSGIDAVAEIAGKDRGLIGIDVAVKTMPPYVWDKISPTELRALMVNNYSARQETTPMLLEDEDQQVFAFRTRDSGLGILQILEVDKSKQMVQFRYKMLQKESAGRIVFLPDADDVIQQGKVAVVLDLTTGKMLPGNKDKQYFNKLNKGDVAYFDDEGKDLLVCFRGAKITRKTANGKYYDTPDQSHTDNTVHIYIIKKTPAEWTITTKEGDIYELKVLSLDNDQAKIKYRKMFRYKMRQGETAQLRVSSHKVFLPECDTTVYDLLDLASSRIINSEPGGEVLDLSKPDGKGNLYFDKAEGQLWLVGVRGTRMRLRSGGELLSSKPDFIARGRNAYYLLGEIPCQYLVTTAQGDKYELKVLSVEMGDRPGVHIEYWKSAESPGAFAVAMPVRGDAAKAMEFLSGLKALMFGVVGAVESDDPNTALLLLDKLIAQSKQFKSTVKDTSVEAAVKAGLEMLDPLRDALEKKQMDRVKSLLAALNQMGPAVESALEKEAAQQGQSKKRTDIRRR